MKKLLTDSSAVEILIIMIIVIVLAGIAIPNFMRVRYNQLQFEKYYRLNIERNK